MKYSQLPGFNQSPGLRHGIVLALGACSLLAPGCLEADKKDASEGAASGDPITDCAEAKTEDACAAVITPITDRGEGCRWGEITRANVAGDACTLEVVGGECMFATFDEGGPGCSGFFRSNEDGEVDLVQLECGDPADDAWTLCFGQEASSPAHAACECLKSGS